MNSFSEVDKSRDIENLIFKIIRDSSIDQFDFKGIDDVGVYTVIIYTELSVDQIKRTRELEILYNADFVKVRDGYAYFVDLKNDRRKIFLSIIKERLLDWAGLK